jgi:GT2 family glycosyltransferase
MIPQPQTTVICATRNAREAVRLTLSSFRRYTPEPCTVLVADNDSTDGTLDDLRATPWLTVFSLQERQSQTCTKAGKSVANFTGHGAALDWLAARVATPYFLTLDSDVEFFGPGWLSEMLACVEARGLVAIGEYEPGRVGYRPRLAPHLLLLRTDAFRALRVSFQSFEYVEDPSEVQRWCARPASFFVDPRELASYRTVALYATGAALFERLVQTRAGWSAIPEATTRKFLHLGHMSWAADISETGSGGQRIRTEYASRLAYVRERLRLYEAPPFGYSREDPHVLA